MSRSKIILPLNAAAPAQSGQAEWPTAETVVPVFGLIVPALSAGTPEALMPPRILRRLASHDCAASATGLAAKQPGTGEEG
jgi:hypothetical protein